MAAGDFSIVPGTPADVWLPLSVTATAPAGTAVIHAFAIHIDFTGATHGIYFDDLDLTLAAEPKSIPEPGAVVLTLFGPIGLLARKRRVALGASVSPTLERFKNRTDRVLQKPVNRCATDRIKQRS